MDRAYQGICSPSSLQQPVLGRLPPACAVASSTVTVSRHHLSTNRLLPSSPEARPHTHRTGFPSRFQVPTEPRTTPGDLREVTPCAAGTLRFCTLLQGGAAPATGVTLAPVLHSLALGLRVRPLNLRPGSQSHAFSSAVPHPRTPLASDRSIQIN